MDSGDQVPKAKFDALALKTKELLAANQALKVERDSIRADAAKLAAALKAKSSVQDNGTTTLHLPSPAPSVVGGFNFIDGSSMSPLIPFVSAPTPSSGFSFVSAITPSSSVSDLASLPSTPAPSVSVASPSTIESSSRLAQELKKAHVTIKQLQQEHSTLENSHVELQQECSRLAQRAAEAEQQHAAAVAKAKHWEQDAQSRVWDSTTKFGANEQALERESSLMKQLEVSQQQEEAAKRAHEELRMSLEVAQKGFAKVQAEAESLRCQLMEKDANSLVQKMDPQSEAKQAELRLLQPALSGPKKEENAMQVELQKLKDQLANYTLKEQTLVEKYEDDLRTLREELNELRKSENVHLLTAKTKEEECKELFMEVASLKDSVKNNDTSREIDDLKKQLEEIREEAKRKDNLILETQQEQHSKEDNRTKEQADAQLKHQITLLQNAIVEMEERAKQEMYQREGKEQAERDEETRRTIQDNLRREQELQATHDTLRKEIEVLMQREKERQEQEKTRAELERRKQEDEEAHRQQIRERDAEEIERLNKQNQQLFSEFEHTKQNLRISESKNEEIVLQLRGLQEQFRVGEIEWKESVTRREQELKQEKEKEIEQINAQMNKKQEEQEILVELLRKKREEFVSKEAMWKEAEKQRETLKQNLEGTQQTIDRKEAEMKAQQEECEHLRQEIQQHIEKSTEKENLWQEEGRERQEQAEIQRKAIDEQFISKDTELQELKEKYEQRVTELNAKITELNLAVVQEQQERRREQQERQNDREAAQREVAEEREQETQLRITQTQALERALATLRADKEEIKRTQNRLELERLEAETTEREENERTMLSLREVAHSAKAALEVRENELRDITSAHLNCDARLQALKAQHTIAIEVVERETTEVKRQLADTKIQSSLFQASLEDATSKEIKQACVIANLEQSLAHQTQASTQKQEELADSVAMMEMELETLRQWEGDREAYITEIEKLKHFQATCQKQTAQLGELNTNIEALKETISKQENEIARLNRVREDYETQLATYRAHSDDLTQTITSLRSQVDAGTSRTLQIANIEQVNQELTERLQTLQTERLKREEEFRQQLRQKEEEWAAVALEHEEAKKKATEEVASSNEDKQRIADELAQEKEIVRSTETELAEQGKQVQDLKQLLRQVEIKLRDKLAVLAEKEAESKTQGEQLSTMQIALLEAKRINSEREAQIISFGAKCSELLAAIDTKDQHTAEINAKLVSQAKETEELKAQWDHIKQQVLKKHNKWKKLEETQTMNYKELVAKYDTAQADIAKLQESVRVLSLEGRKKDQNISDQTDAILKLCATEHDLRTQIGLAAKRERQMAVGMARAIQK